MSGEPELADFAAYLTRVCAKAPATARAYCLDLAAYFQYCANSGMDPQQQLTRAGVGIYLMERLGDRRRSDAESAQLGPRSAARALSALSNYCKYLIFTGALKEHPLAGMKSPKYRRKLPPYFSVHELMQLLAVHADKDSPASLRNHALLLLLYASGLRVSECSGLDLLALDFTGNLLLATGKGSKQRVIPFGQPVAQALRAWLSQGRPALAAGHSGPAVWLSQRGTRFSPRSIQQMLDRTAAQAGLAKPISPHKLRHACATHMLEGGADIRLLQEMLGHESLDTTQVYTRVTNTRLREVYTESHPRAGGPHLPPHKPGP